MRLCHTLPVLLLTVTSIWAGPNYTGRSGAPTRQTCASSCHGQAGGSVTITGFPATYTPDSSYLITISRISGSSINNFNGSCRVGTGTTNAGTLSAGTNTTTYNVSGETNGIRLSSVNQTSGTFNWRAPTTGTGQVRLYIGAYQGTSRSSGLNTTIVAISEEAVSAPEAATDPQPADQAMDILPDASLSWTAGAGAVAHDVFFGTSIPPDSVASTANPSYDPPGSLEPGTTYYWQINERNDAGITAGPLWQFTVLSLPGAAREPWPADSASHVPVDTILYWTAGDGTVSHDVYFGTETPPPMVASNVSGAAEYATGPMEHDTVYYWRIDERNAAGVTEGPIWSFRTEIVNALDETPESPENFALFPAYPNPFNGTVSISYMLPRTVAVDLTAFDLNGRRVGMIHAGVAAAGSHTVQWQADDLPSGMYILRLTTPLGRRSEKVLLVK